MKMTGMTMTSMTDGASEPQVTWHEGAQEGLNPQSEGGLPSVRLKDTDHRDTQNYGWRRPVVYNPEINEVRVGPYGSYHSDIGFGSDNEYSGFVSKGGEGNPQAGLGWFRDNYDRDNVEFPDFHKKVQQALTPHDPNAAYDVDLNDLYGEDDDWDDEDYREPNYSLGSIQPLYDDRSAMAQAVIRAIEGLRAQGLPIPPDLAEAEPTALKALQKMGNEGFMEFNQRGLNTPPEKYQDPWEPGYAGKGIIFDDGSLEHWKVDDTGWPHHIFHPAPKPDRLAEIAISEEGNAYPIRVRNNFEPEALERTNDILRSEGFEPQDRMRRYDPFEPGLWEEHTASTAPDWIWEEAMDLEDPQEMYDYLKKVLPQYIDPSKVESEIKSAFEEWGEEWPPEPAAMRWKSWKPGQAGKGFVGQDGEVYHWPIANSYNLDPEQDSLYYNSGPHHAEIGDKLFGGWNTFHSPFWINPNGGVNVYPSAWGKDYTRPEDIPKIINSHPAFHEWDPYKAFEEEDWDDEDDENELLRRNLASGRPKVCPKCKSNLDVKGVCTKCGNQVKVASPDDWYDEYEPDEPQPDQIIPWDGEGRGKGFLDLEGKLHTWNDDATRFPWTHYDYSDHAGVEPNWTTPFYLNPDGRLIGSPNLQKYLPEIQRQDPRITGVGFDPSSLFGEGWNDHVSNSNESYADTFKRVYGEATLGQAVG